MEVGNADDYPNPGRSRKVTDKVIKIVLDLIFSKNSPLTLREGVEKLNKKRIEISHETIRRHLRASNIKYRSTLLIPRREAT